MSNHPSRSSTPVQRVGTPIQRVGTPNRGSRQGTPVIFNASDKLVKVNLKLFRYLNRHFRE